MTRRVGVVSVGLIALTLAACGGDGSGGNDREPKGPEPLTRAEESVVSASQTEIRSYCRRIGGFLAGTGPRPTTADLDQARQAVQRLAALAREDPEAEYRDLQTMRQVLGDAAEDLEGSNCSPALLAELRRGLASLPAP